MLSSIKAARKKKEKEEDEEEKEEEDAVRGGESSLWSICSIEEREPRRATH